MENKHTITLRYIREKLYYVNVPDILWDYLVEKNCNRSEILVYMYYLREWSKKQRSNIASISSETLAEKLGISPKSVKNANKKLESLELIERRQETRFSQIDLRYSSTAITTPKIPDELTKRIEIQGQRMRNYHDPVLGEIISIDDLNEKLNKFEADQIRNLRTNAQRIKDIIYHYLINSPNSVDNHFDKMDEIAIDIKNKVIGSGLPAEDQKVLMIQKFSEYLAAQIAWSIYPGFLIGPRQVSQTVQVTAMTVHWRSWLVNNRSIPVVWTHGPLSPIESGRGSPGFYPGTS